MKMVSKYIKKAIRIFYSAMKLLQTIKLHYQIGESIDQLKEKLDQQNDLIILFNSPAKEKSILLVEPNDCHGEILPGIIDYLIQAGYFVDVIITPKQYAEQPLECYSNPMMRIFSFDHDVIGKILGTDRISYYDFLFFNSQHIYKITKNLKSEIVCFSKYYSMIMQPKYGMLAICHHLDLANEKMLQEGRLGFLGNYCTNLPVQPFLVSAHLWKKANITSKNDKITYFISIGKLEKGRRNFSLLIDAVLHLHREYINQFRVIVIGSGYSGHIQKEISSYFELMGRTNYPILYSKLKQSDFVLPLLDPEIIEHNRYLSTGLSGFSLLCYSFQKPCIIAKKFSSYYGFSSDNSIIYSDNSELHYAMKQAILMSSKDYINMQNNIKIYSDYLYKLSLNNIIDTTKKISSI